MKIFAEKEFRKVLFFDTDLKVGAMMKGKIIGLMLIFPSILISYIVETSQFHDILAHLEYAAPDKTLVVFDIDNTLLEASQHLGSVAWADYLISNMKSKGIDHKKAQEIENVFWMIVHPHIQVQAVDPNTSQVIQEIQNRTITILGLTARTPDEFGYTFKQLRSIGIDLTNQKQLPLSDQQILLDARASYQEGVLFSTPYNKKSEVLYAFLENNHIEPECIIFVDDKHHHVVDVQRASEDRGLKFIGIRFSGADKQFINFNPAIAEIQWGVFPTIISDQEALEMLFRRNNS